MQVKRGIINFFRAGLKGGALYIAIVISIVVGVMLSMFLLLSSLNQRQLTGFLQREQLQNDIESALAMSQSSYFTETQNGRWIKNSFNDDSIKIFKSYWGAYELISAQAKNKHDRISRSALYGVMMSKDTGLVVCENGRQVGLSGNIAFKANCYLPSPGIKPTFIEGKSYVGAAENAAHIKSSGQLLIEIDPAFGEGLKDQYFGKFNFNDSIGQLTMDPVSVKFTNKTLVIPSLSGRLSGLNLKGNIKLIGRDLIIDSSCNLNDILIICNKVKFNIGFKGNVHVISTDSIVCGKRCKFSFPSSFVLLRELSDIKGMSFIETGSDNLFEGGIVAIAKERSSQNVLVKLNAESEVCGLVYSPILHLEGRLNANVYCDKLLLKTASAVYENHFMSCEIDPAKYAGFLSVPSIFRKKVKRTKCVTY